MSETVVFCAVLVGCLLLLYTVGLVALQFTALFCYLYEYLYLYCLAIYSPCVPTLS